MTEDQIRADLLAQRENIDELRQTIGQLSQTVAVMAESMRHMQVSLNESREQSRWLLRAVLGAAMIVVVGFALQGGFAGKFNVSPTGPVAGSKSP